MAPLLRTYQKLTRYPLGHWLFSKAVCFKAPYFSTIKPRFIALEAGRCEVEIADRRAVHNHIGTVHAIALCNLAELCAGVMTDASIPADMRWIPKGMTVEYLRKATGTLRGVATPAKPIVSAGEAYELPVIVEVTDRDGKKVFTAQIGMWVSPKR
jgi:acyl-coenzyme A thioesterase PaaI-like protein